MSGYLRLAAVFAIGVALATSAVARADAEPGSQGTDTSLPSTDSAMTVPGRGKYADLKITVNQTEHLLNQAVSVTWTGGTPSNRPGSRFFGDFLQIMQCWGDPDGTVPGNPGPPPAQCEQGATMGAYNPPDSAVNRGATRRLLGLDSWDVFDPNIGYHDASTHEWWMPFRAVDGTTINIQENAKFDPSNPNGDYWLNPYFNMVTTNEVVAGPTQKDGSGSELFQVVTGVESSGLGCGQRVQHLADGTTKVPQCWIVVVPRGTPTEESEGFPFALPELAGVQTSPLIPSAWANRIAIPISFNPVDSPCSIADIERRIAGNDLAHPAIESWQPVLCSGAGSPPYSYAPVADSTARSLLSHPQPGSAGMVVLSEPLPPANVDPDKPIVYSPLSISGVVIGFNAERNPKSEAPATEQELAGIRVAEMNLTPRLVAKLLTQSYSSQFTISGVSPRFDWMQDNARHLGADPDFVRFNPEFDLLDIGDTRTFGGLQLPLGNSDAARKVWEWILADSEAATWLAGVPDEWGMRVNPIYSTNPAVNPSGLAFADPLPNSYPKSDSYCYQPPATATFLPPAACAIEVIPYAQNMRDAAVRARTAYDAAKIAGNPFANNSFEYWKATEPQRIGARSMLALTDTASAARFGLQTARLSRAGDDGAGREFVASTSTALTSAVDAMSPGEEPQVRELAPAAVPAGAYPLTTMTYAASAPLGLDAKARAEYAAFLRYAVTQGQHPGLELGMLPPGYAPLPAGLVAQGLHSAELIESLEPAEPAEPATTTPTTVASSSVPQADDQAPSDIPAVQSSPSTSSGRRKPAATSSTSTSTPESTASTTVPAASAFSTTPTSSQPTSSVAGSTPSSSVAPALRWAMPSLAGFSLLSALAAMEISRRPRRASLMLKIEETSVEM